jgi:HAD superfamily hydrolase (TIGR01509 family)
MIEAVIFDMDGLMLDTQRMATKAWKLATAEFGFTLSDELNLQLIGRSPQDSIAILKKELGADFPVEDCRKRATEFYFEDISQNGIPIKPGLLELIHFLKDKSIDIAVATSTPRVLTIRNLRIAKLVSHFKVIITGDDIQNGKPSPDIFLVTAKLLNTPPEKCIVLEDSFPGIWAAHAAKMIPIMVPDLVQPNDEVRSIAYAVVPSLYDAKREIENLIR